MADEVTYRTRWGGINLSYPTAALMLMFVAVQLGAVAIYGYIDSMQYEMVPSEQTSSPLPVIHFLALVVVESLVIVALYRYAETLLKFIVKAYALIMGSSVALLVIIAFHQDPELRIPLLSLLALGIGLYTLYKLGIEWLPWNLAACLFAATGAAVGGAIVGPEPVILLLLLMMAWDYLAVFVGEWMQELVSFSASYSIPNFVVVPNKLHVDMEAVTEWLADEDVVEKPDSVAVMLGVGDLVLPTVLVISALIAYASTAPAIGTGVGSVASLGVLMSALERGDGSLPALPWINSGAVLGFTIGSVVMVL